MTNNYILEIEMEKIQIAIQSYKSHTKYGPRKNGTTYYRLLFKKPGCAVYDAIYRKFRSTGAVMKYAKTMVEAMKSPTFEFTTKLNK